MKILLVNKFHYLKGGSETYYFALAEALKEKGHEVIFFSMKHEKNIPCEQTKYFVSNKDYNQQKLSVFKKIKMTASFVYSFEAKKKMKRLIAAEKPDIVLFNLVHRHLTLSIIDPIKKKNIPIGFMLHDCICACPNYLMLHNNQFCDKCIDGDFTNCIKQKCIKNSTIKSWIGAMEAWTIRFLKLYDKIDFYIVPSAFMKHKMEEANFTKSPILNITNPLPLHHKVEYSPSKNQELFFFGRISREKGILTLLKAMKDTDPSVHLKIAGEGPQKEEVLQYVKENHLEERVTFLGFITGEVLEKTIAQSKCVVVPSECHEGCPYTILEALAKGKPVIFREIKGFPQLIRNGENGYLFPPGDSKALAGRINHLMNLSRDDYKAMCFSAMDTVVNECNMSKYTTQLLGQYEKIIKEKRRKKLKNKKIKR